MHPILHHYQGENFVIGICKETEASILTRETNNREIRLKPGDTIGKAICVAYKLLIFKSFNATCTQICICEVHELVHTHALQAYPHVSFDHPIPTNQI